MGALVLNFLRDYWSLQEACIKWIGGHILPFKCLVSAKLARGLGKNGYLKLKDFCHFSTFMSVLYFMSMNLF